MPLQLFKVMRLPGQFNRLIHFSVLYHKTRHFIRGYMKSNLSRRQHLIDYLIERQEKCRTFSTRAKT